MSVIGIYGVENASSILYYGLHSLQHRGQQGAGMVTVENGETMHRHRGLGLVSEVFDKNVLEELKGNIGIGSVQYSNLKCDGVDNVQPFFFHHFSGDFALAHNGFIVNAEDLVEELEAKGSLFHTNSDAEILAHLIKKVGDEPRIFPLVDALAKMDGGFAFVVMTKNRIYAARDRHGFRPLAIGSLGSGYVVASESCAFDLIGATFIRDVAPGEVITIDEKGIRSRFFAEDCHNHICGMEFIYFARPDSDIDGCNVHAYRKESGRILFRESPADVDIVIGVPDSSLSAAMGYAEEGHIPYEMGLIKSKYVGRTFIQPSQQMRDNGVKMKLSAVRSIVNGKRVALVDDSIVRGTTSLKIIKLLREAGAVEVHMRIASPMMKHPCFYGVDTSTYEELLCSQRNLDEACKAIGADSLAYLSPESTIKSCPGRTEMCLACFTGQYPTELYRHKK